MRDKYEISLWEDYLVESSGDIEQDNYVPAHFEERKLCVIGSDTMTDSFRAFNPQLVSNINGTHTFEFKMYYTITENEISIEKTSSSGFVLDEDGNFVISESNENIAADGSISTQKFIIEKRKNPFLSLLVNERKIKVFWKNEWYDFVIKNCQEDSSGKCITYVCTDVFINELSKNGFDIVLDTELENNSGTILELAETILKGTDWTLDKVGSDIIQQKKEEPVYEVTTLKSWTLTDQTALQEATIPAGEKILIFYQQVQDMLNSSVTSKTTDIQFAYADSYERDTNSQLVINAHCYEDNVILTKAEYEGVECLVIGPTANPYARVFYKGGVSSNYRASRLVKSQVNKLDTLTGKYCNVWDVDPEEEIPEQYEGLIEEGDEIYEYRATEWNDALIVNNLVVNPKNFAGNEGWIGDDLTFQLYPPYSSREDISTYEANSYLHLKGDADFYNDGIRSQSNFIPNGFAIGETYIFRYKARTNGSSGPSDTYAITGITPIICTYKDEEGQRIIDDEGDVYFEIPEDYEPIIDSVNHWVEWKLNCIKSITRSEIYEKKIALFLQTSATVWLEEAQFFKEVYGTDGTNPVRINPGEINIDSVATTKYVYFNHTKTQGLVNAGDVNPLWSSTSDWNPDFLVPRYNENFEKIRSISAKQSNRFNLIQSLAETFECWAQFTIKHDSTGKIVYNEDGTPQKFVSFKNEIGQETGIGFIYGIDLKAISRTIQSDEIVTKTIVSPNNNEFAEKGFCTIARSKENYPRTNFLLNFDYFINQGLIDGGAFNNDLYDSTQTTGIGYYYLLNQYNTQYDAITEFLDAKRLELLKQLSYQTVYDGTITSFLENISNLKSDLMRLANVDTWAAATAWIKANADQNQVSSKMVALKNAEDNLATYQTMKANLDTSIEQLSTAISSKEEDQKQLINNIEALDLKFYKKYSRFIQEGSWTSEDYIDDNLYYLDAQSVAYTSSRPQISYDISVLRISGIEEFKNKVFHLGDISFIQDPEFFGYVYINGIKTPYKEKVLISEITSYFDSPEQDTFKVQNYKTQFEDLFQRITSTTQSLQYASGSYARAAGIVEPTGVINSETLQNSISLNEQLVFSAQNEAVITDSTGLTVADSTNPNKKSKITSGGLFITTDGGATWKNAVRGEGIATQFLTTGSINTNSINIMDGNFKTFRWDESGINAYYKLSGDSGINLSKFVRFDHFGIYGIDTNASEGETYEPEEEEDIWNDAKFGMTWKGFFIKNKYGTHSVEISSTDDIRIVSNPQTENGSPVELIKIGSLDEDHTLFGIRISDTAGDPVMETDNTGKLWLKDRLNISSTNGGYSIGIGYLENRKPLTDIHEVFNVNNGAFLVYEDGSIKATSGTIGGMSIEEVEKNFYEIVSNKDKIYKIYSDDSNELTYSPDYISFSVYEPDGYTPVPTSNYTSQIDAIGQDASISNIFTLLGNLEGEYTLEVPSTGPIIVNLLTAIRTVTTNTITFNFKELFNYDVSFIDPHERQESWPSHPNTNEETDIENFNALLKIISEDNIDFVITTSGSNTPSLSKTIPVEFSVTDATASVMSVIAGSSSLTFSQEGLEVRNGGLTIYNDDAEEEQESERIFYFDPNDRFLHIKGSGEFTGSIHATSGDFTGDVVANTLIAIAGSIGGFEIRDNGLYSVNESVKLLGIDGRIEADNINLGTGAHINKYIQLGSAYLWNPEDSDADGMLIEAGAIKLTQLGIMNLGQITLDGPNSEIRGNSFTITPNLTTFNNVSVSGKISTAIFEKGHIQSVGGSMLFKPSYSIESYSGYTVTLDKDYDGKKDNYIYLVKEDGSILNGLIQVDDIDGNVVTLTKDISNSGNLISLIDIGAEDAVIIGVNSSDALTTFLNPRGITISEFNTNNEKRNPKVYLGDLDKSGIIFPTSDKERRGFGLYSENVYLTGSLTTQVGNSEESTYAGVNTLDGASANVFGTDDTSKIVFWAGSKDTTASQIQKAPFQVTEAGSIYATRGVFTGAIIAKSYIQGADIYAARIHGNGENPYGLSFYDTNNGIIFYQGDPDNGDAPSEVFSIGNNGLRKGNNYFIDISNSGINFNGENFKGTNYYTNGTGNFYIHLYENYIVGAHVNEDDDSEIVDTKINFNSQEIIFGIGSSSNTMDITSTSINMNTPNVQFGDKVKYEIKENGYNLFILN